VVVSVRPVIYLAALILLDRQHQCSDCCG